MRKVLTKNLRAPSRQILENQGSMHLGMALKHGSSAGNLPGFEPDAKTEERFRSALGAAVYTGCRLARWT